MTILMGHKAEKVSSWLQSTADCGSGRMSQLFRFFFVFLGLRIFTRIYCIWSRTREQNFNDVLSYNWPPFLIMSRLTYPNDLPMTSNSLFFSLLILCSLLFDLSSTGLIKDRGTKCFISRKREPHPTKPQKVEYEVTSFLIRFLWLWSRKGEPAAIFFFENYISTLAHKPKIQT